VAPAEPEDTAMIEGNRLMAFIPVSDADRKRSFCRDTLGLRLISEDGLTLVFDVEGSQLP
jgi:hypothetical protein